MASYNFKSRDLDDDEEDDLVEEAKLKSAEFRKKCKFTLKK